MPPEYRSRQLRTGIGRASQPFSRGFRGSSIAGSGTERRPGLRICPDFSTGRAAVSRRHSGWETPPDFEAQAPWPEDMVVRGWMPRIPKTGPEREGHRRKKRTGPDYGTRGTRLIVPLLPRDGARVRGHRVNAREQVATVGRGLVLATSALPPSGRDRRRPGRQFPLTLCIRAARSEAMAGLRRSRPARAFSRKPSALALRLRSAWRSLPMW